MKKSKRIIVMMASIILVIAVSISGTLAWISASTPAVENSFERVQVPNKVVETFTDNVKSNVKIKNVGQTDAYVRAAIVVTWVEVNASGDPTGNVHYIAPGSDDYNMVLNTSTSGAIDTWFSGNDGYYYYTSKISPNNATEILISSCSEKANSNKPASSESGCEYVLSVEIMGQTIQAEPDSVVTSVWTPVTAVNNGVLTVTPKS